MFKVYAQTYKAGSFVPRAHIPPFHWEYTHREVFDAVGSLSALGARLPELNPGQGDVLVAKGSALGRIDPANASSARIRSLSRPIGELVVRRNHGDIVASPRVMRW